MPITIACACGANLKAPDTAAGKRVKCPKCGGAISVPAAEVEYEEADEPRPPRASRKPRMDDDEDDRPARRRRRDYDEDEDEDDRPRRKDNRRRKPKSQLPLLIGVTGGVALLMLAAWWGFAWWMESSAPPQIKGGTTSATLPKAVTPPAVLPARWKKVQGEGFSVGLPDGVGLKAGEKTGPGGQKGKTWTSELNTDTMFLVTKAEIPAADIAKFQKKRATTWEGIVSSAEEGASPATRVGPAQEVTTADGLDGRQFTLKHGESQMLCAIYVDERGAMYQLMVVQPFGAKPEDSRAKTFFESFRLENAK